MKKLMSFAARCRQNPARRAMLALAASLAPCAAGAQIAAEQSIALTPAVQNAAYASGNAMGGLLTVPALRAVRPPAGILNWLSVASKSGQTPSLTVYVFDTIPGSSTCADKTAFSLASADAAKVVAAVVLPPLAVPTGATASFGIAQNLALSLRNQDNPQTPNFYACVVTGSALTPGSTSDIVAKFGLTQD
jgi:hypothetical protein